MLAFTGRPSNIASAIPARFVKRFEESVKSTESNAWEKICALQLEYSLTERNIEREHVPAALHFGMGICPWSPLASGLLTGKYTREKRDTGRLAVAASSGNPVFEKFTERNFTIVDTLLEVAGQLGRAPAQVALNWITRRPGVASTIIGATKPEQLKDNLSALEFEIPTELGARLEEASRPERQFPYLFFSPAMQEMITGGADVHAEPAWYRGEWEAA